MSLMDLGGLPSWLWPKCNRLLTGRPWGAVTLSRRGGWWYMDMECWEGSYPDCGRYGNLPLQGKIPMAEPGIEPGTSWSVVGKRDHQAGHRTDCLRVTLLPERELTKFKKCFKADSSNTTWGLCSWSCVPEGSSLLGCYTMSVAWLHISMVQDLLRLKS
jgi:hypothetical protein